jgi:hypothetical protein
MEELNLKKDLTYKEHPVKIIETAERITRSKTIKMCKVQWSHGDHTFSFMAPYIGPGNIRLLLFDSFILL